jgi:hypothetical protein
MGVEWQQSFCSLVDGRVGKAFNVVTNFEKDLSLSHYIVGLLTVESK